jgi:hypothetical protein
MNFKQIVFKNIERFVPYKILKKKKKKSYPGYSNRAAKRLKVKVERTCCGIWGFVLGLKEGKIK